MPHPASPIVWTITGPRESPPGVGGKEVNTMELTVLMIPINILVGTILGSLLVTSRIPLPAKAAVTLGYAFASGMLTFFVCSNPKFL